MPKVYLAVHGCSSNLADYEIAAGLLTQAGFELVDNSEKSDLNVIFTCIVKFRTFNRMLHMIKQMTNLKKPLIVAGCMTKTERRLIEKLNPDASLVAPDSVEKIVEAAGSALEGKKVVFLEDQNKPKLNLPRRRINPVIGIVPIARGCLQKCSYCHEPYRGKLFSYPLKEIVSEVKRAVAEGCKEIWLTSLDNGCYGLDGGTNLAELLNAVCGVEGKFFVRVGMINPLHAKNMLKELIEAYRNPKIFKFIHLPLQAGSDKILRLMERGYQVKDFVEIVEEFREKLPELTLATDVITGFPEESDSDFKRTLELIRRIKPEVTNVSKFGARPWVKASGYEQLPGDVIKERSKELFNLCKTIWLEKNKKWIGWEGECLIDEKGRKENTWIGRNFAYKPIVVHSTENLLGKFLKVKVVGAAHTYLLGTVIQEFDG
ncbi:MAG: tRNA (N(6)-L-threonylcarbamoyladenosine(37)-C(2))-methylthiotransferase [Candidatus Hadarchaeum sp.]|uniref:tRNA (N(6)-L-threonylcarbamoyladenosine(37)-C(2))- methylthiotransferase n=1 Tax=Candidatus Hadarchaeum sp. TaxID=2883567 RepID=UPI00317E6BEC